MSGIAVLLVWVVIIIFIIFGSRALTVYRLTRQVARQRAAAASRAAHPAGKGL